MQTLPFGWDGNGSLATELAKPIRQVTVEMTAHGNVSSVTLRPFDGIGLRIQSSMCDVADRREVGVLQFSTASPQTSAECALPVPASFGDGAKPFKLTILESGTTAESGVMLKAIDGQKIIVIAGAFPYSLSVAGVPLVSKVFRPEYQMDDYDVVEM